MAKSETTKIVILGAVALGAVWMLTRKQAAVQPPAPQVAQQQLQQWAQTQPNTNVLQSVINNLSIDDLLDLWDRIFGKKETTTTPTYTDDSDLYGWDDLFGGSSWV